MNNEPLLAPILNELITFCNILPQADWKGYKPFTRNKIFDFVDRVPAVPVGPAFGWRMENSEGVFRKCAFPIFAFHFSISIVLFQSIFVILIIVIFNLSDF
ncbi:MAG: hypothetical protein J5906_01860 [Acidaminococcaceae bacterium]|nr:hypothetical protein [Acidaminococcaceae bacterium]